MHPIIVKPSNANQVYNMRSGLLARAVRRMELVGKRLITVDGRKSFFCDSHPYLCVVCVKLRNMLKFHAVGKNSVNVPIRILTKKGVVLMFSDSSYFVPYDIRVNASGSPLRDAANNYASKAAGDVIQICVFGRAKERVDGTDNIAIGDAIVTHAAAGYAMLASIDTSLPAAWSSATMYTVLTRLGSVHATALGAATADGDIILVFVKPASGTLT